MMPLQSEIASMEKALQETYVDRCTITREVLADGSYGGQTQTPSTVASNVPCQVTTTASSLFPSEVLAKQVQLRQNFTVSMPPGTDVQVGDLLTITTQGNQEMVVAAVLNPESTELEMRVMASLEGEHHV